VRFLKSEYTSRHQFGQRRKGIHTQFYAHERSLEALPSSLASVVPPTPSLEPLSGTPFVVDGLCLSGLISERYPGGGDNPASCSIDGTPGPRVFLVADGGRFCRGLVMRRTETVEEGRIAALAGSTPERGS
jgi:hypothetical protein